MSDADEIERKVIEMLTGHVGDKVELSADTRIMADTEMDSVAVMDFVLDLEDQFDIIIPLNRLAEITTVGELVGAIQKLASEN